MSEVSVNRTAAGGYCLIIDGTRVAGAKPEFSGDNCVCWWETNETIGVVDDLEAENTRLKTENEKLRERVSELEELTDHRHYIPQEWYATLQAENAKLRELVSLMDKRDVLLPCWRGCDAVCHFYGSHCERIGTLMGELGFEVQS